MNPEPCSAADLSGRTASYRRSFVDLPPAVAATREVLIRAALACDFETLIALAAQGAAGDGNDSILSGATADVEQLAGFDRSFAALRHLVLAFTTVAYDRFAGERYDAEKQVAVPEVYYQWPPTAVLYDASTDREYGLDEVWDEETVIRVAALNGMTPDELLGSAVEFGGYVGFRIGILEDGRWWFAGEGG